MYISKLLLQAFGKFHNKEIDLRPGINLVYGSNEAGKTTVKEFILGMLYGIDKSRGLAARLDNYELRKPLDGQGYSGVLYMCKDSNEYIVERNFDRNNKKVSVRNVNTGREYPLGETGLVGKLIDVEKNRYLDTLCIGQQGADTSSNLADAIHNYMINMAAGMTTEMDYEGAMEYLKQEKKKYNTKSLDEQLDKLSEEFTAQKNYEIGLVNVKYRLDKLEEEYNAKSKVIEQKEDDNFDELEEETSKKITNIMVFMLAVLAVLTLVIVGVVVFLPVAKTLQIVLGILELVLVIFTIARCGIIRTRLREKQIERSIMIKQKQTDDKADALSFAKDYAAKVTEIKTEETKIIEEKARIEEHIKSYDGIKLKRDRYAIEVKAIEQAMDTIRNLSEHIYDAFGKEFNDNVSTIVSHMTDGKYSKIKLDEKLHVTVREGDCFVGIEYLSKGTIEQIYLAVRLAAARLLEVNDMPIIIDDIFGAYDETRLKKTLEYIEAFNTSQIIIFSADNHMGDMLEKLHKDYNYIEI